MQPRIGVDLELSKKTKFIELYSIHGGIDFYTNAISDIYQDYFGEGIFTGKGIYDVDVYNEVLEGEIEENTVLSHDLLEGNYLRCGLLTDVILLDGYPLRYLPYILRNHRWVRGDWQILKWVKNNKLNALSKFKILDNLRRSLVTPIAFIGVITGIICNKINCGYGNLLLCISFVSLIITYVIDLINYIIFKESIVTGSVYAYKKFSNDLKNNAISLYRIFLTIFFLPYEAYKNLDSICKSLYRMKRKMKLLEWVTAEDGERNLKFDLKTYYNEMLINVTFGILFLLINTIESIVLGLIWIIAPFIAYYISKEDSKSLEINESQKNYLTAIGKLTWLFFENYISENDNYLMIDNYQEDRKDKIVHRTSSTNIGLEYIAVISAYDLKYISKENAIEYIKKITNTVNILPKWNGHLYNWYNTVTLESLTPAYVSTVDSGNFIGYLYIVKQFLLEENVNNDYNYLINNIDEIINNTDFSKLYNPEVRLFSIGFNIEENQLTDSYYDFLASESRQASLVAIAKGDVSAKHWSTFSRSVTSLNGYKGLISWTGTAFEYLMPNINLKRYSSSLLDESCKFAIYSQIEYCKKLNVPWGISESAYNLRDLNNNYQYKAFGIPWLGLKRGLEDDIVVSPYSTFLSLEDVPIEGIKNLRLLESNGALGKFGFYESIDYTKSRLNNNQNYEVIKTYMAHHQGLILTSINNMINKNILKNRFSNNPEIEAMNILLQEKMPVQMIVTKEKKEKIIKNKSYADSGYFERNVENVETNVISNGNYKILINSDGQSVSYYNDIMINNYKKTLEIDQGIFFYLKNARTKKIKRISECDKVIFAPDKVRFLGQENNLRYELVVALDQNRDIEIRRLTLENIGNNDEIFEVICDFEPCLSAPRSEYAHPAFNKMFIRFEGDEDKIIVKRVLRDFSNEIYLLVNLHTDANQIGNLEYELDNEKYRGRENYDIPDLVKKQKNFTSKIIQTVEPVIAMKRTIKIEAGSKVNVNLILIVGNTKQEVEKLAENVNGDKEINKILNIAKLKIEEQNKFLQIKSRNLELYHKLLNYILNNKLRKFIDKNVECEINNLWKFGISGDIPIISVRISRIEDIYILKELIKAYEYYRIKGIIIDFVIINNENNVYEKYVNDAINTLIMEKQLNYLKNIFGGIYVLNEKKLSKEEINTFLLKSNVFLDAHEGDLNNFIFENEKKNYIKLKSRINNFEKNLDEVVYSLKKFENKYDNFYGCFINNGKEYLIYKNPDDKLPSVWCNILANNNFGTVVTDNLGGYIWHKNSRLNKLTVWNNNQLKDFPSEIYYVKDQDNGDCWTLNSSISPNKNYYYIKHGFGYTNIENSTDNLIQNIDVFVPIEDSVKILNFKFKNIINKKRNLKILVYIKPVIGEDEIVTNGNIQLEKINDNIILVKNMINNEIYNDKKMYIITSENIAGFTGDKESFFGNGDIKYPESLNKSMDCYNGLGKDSCIGIEFEICIDKLSNKDFFVLIGNEREKEKIIEKYTKYKQNEYIECKLNEVKSNWNNILDVVNIKTPSESINILINGWIVYQTISSRLMARSGYYQSGGAYGFRDQLQDCLGLKYVNSEYLRTQILNCCMHQFIEGDVLHWWHQETKKGIRTRFSDDLLWLVYAVIEYIEFTNDNSILDEKVEYIKGELLVDNEIEKYEHFHESNIKEDVFEHCVKSIENVISKGIERFPKIGVGDWNDGFSNIGSKGKGESVWLGFFLYDILNRFIPFCKLKNKDDLVRKYSEINDNLRKKLNSEGWDGRWYKRAINDDGVEIGSINSNECRIDSISQSWSVISGAGDNDKKFISIDEAERYLVDRENKIIKLFDPPFENSDFNPGYIKSYPAGVRENGGQYTHASIWLIIAECLLGFGDKAVEFAEMINPIEHSRTRDDAKRFKLEPYIMEADIYTNKDMCGRGGWNWYTGSSSWYFKSIIEYILGLKIKNGYLYLKPCISKKWENFEIKYKYKTTQYNITVINKNAKNTGVERFVVNGEDMVDKKVQLLNDGKIYNIQIFM